MKTYFSCITTDHWKAKNNLEKAAKDLANEMNRRLILDTEMDAFKKEFKEKIEALHLKYPRCKPLRFTIQSARNYRAGNDIWIYCDGVFQMSLYLVKQKTIAPAAQALPDCFKSEYCDKQTSDQRCTSMDGCNFSETGTNQ